jgi:D-beta-D-heptose 7-phosphate kinase/D-beta-D-heptose 1-phosphate adenosyltransferase
MDVRHKLKRLDEVAAIAAAARREGKKVVFTNGCFDLVHRGHLHILRGARAAGDLLIVGINTDRSVRIIKGPARPILSEIDRSELIASLEMVDYVVLFDEPTPLSLIAAIKPDVLVKGGDWGPDQVVGADLVRQSGGEVVLVPYLKGFSTTNIIERTQKKDG